MSKIGLIVNYLVNHAIHPYFSLVLVSLLVAALLRTGASRGLPYTILQLFEHLGVFSTEE
jgi:hypothetical protein